MENLEDLRSEIDACDLEILRAIKKRGDVVARVKNLKESRKTEGFRLFINILRETSMLENLQKKSHNIGVAYQNPTIFHIWRTIISASNLLEQTLNFGIISGASVFDFCDFYPCIFPVEYTSQSQAIQGLISDDIHILAFDSTISNCIKQEISGSDISIFASHKSLNFAGKIKA